VQPTDLVLAARGGGKWLDHFEDENVVDALDGIVHGMFETPSSAIYRLERMLRDARSASHSASVPSPMREHAAQIGELVSTAGRRNLIHGSPRTHRARLADTRLAIGAVTIVAALGLLVLLIFPARRSAIPATPAPSAFAASKDEDRSGRAQTARSAAQKPAGKSHAATTAPTQAHDVSSEHSPGRAESKTAAALQRCSGPQISLPLQGK
jgi:hypothetical protein